MGLGENFYFCKSCGTDVNCGQINCEYCQGVEDDSEPDSFDALNRLNHIDELAAYFQNWCSAQNLPQMSADEILSSNKASLNDYQTKFLKQFIAVWEIADEQ